jgi:nitroreductase
MDGSTAGRAASKEGMDYTIEKPAEADRALYPLLARRWSPNAFSPEAVDGGTLETLFEAARWSASCSNDQPWFYLVARREDGAAWETMLGCLDEGNIQWARTAPVLAIGVARLTFARNGKPNRWGYYDLGQSAAYLTVQAMAMGLWVHQMGGFDAEKVRKVYGVPEGYDPVAAIAMGKMGDPSVLPEYLRARHTGPRSGRKALREFVFTGRWGEAAF